MFRKQKTSRKYYESSRPEMESLITVAPKRCIEFGCSSGGFSETLKKKYNCETWGIDMDEQSVEIARTKMDKVFMGNAFELVDQLPDNYFDYIICNDFIEHLHSPELFFNKTRRCLTDEAILICSLPNTRHWKNVYRFLILKDWKYKKSGILDYTHLRFFTKRSMKRSIKKWGFTIEKIKGIRPAITPFFYLLALLTFNSIGDMRFRQYGFRARLKEKIGSKPEVTVG
jgi:2-polyprenyl-3-methyl-5-hydroxy-6-metoxy-1,4-benzoquinol methylase